MKHVNSQLWNSFAKLRSFPRATLQHLRHYIVPSLINETPNRIILHGGCIDVNNKNSTPEKIGNEIADLAILCCDYGVNDVFISAIICRRDKFLNGKVKCVNFLLKQICEENGYFFIDNSNIEIRDLRKDDTHLLESGKTKLAEKFIFFKQSYWLSPHYFLEAHTHRNIEHTHSQLLNTKNCELISNKNILNTNTSNEVNNENNVLKNLRLKTRINL